MIEYRGVQRWARWVSGEGDGHGCAHGWVYDGGGFGMAWPITLKE